MPTATEVREPQVEDRVNVWEAARVQPTGKTLPIPQLQRPLFADSLLDSGQQEKTRRRFAAVLSFTFQCLLIGVLLVVPLMFTEELPRQQLLTFLEAPPPPPPPAAEAVARVVRQIQSDLLTGGQLRTPSRIPEKVQMIREEEAPPPCPWAVWLEECREASRADSSVGSLAAFSARLRAWLPCRSSPYRLLPNEFAFRRE